MWLLAMLGCNADGELEVPDFSFEITDGALVQALIESGEPDDGGEVAAAVAWSDGWPVHKEGDTWIFLYTTLDAAPGLAGDFNGWVAEPMTEGNGFFWAEVSIPDAAGQKYKFVEGQDWISDPMARNYTFDDNGRVSYVAPPTDVFHLELWPHNEVEGTALDARDLRVYVPPGPGPWPVLYMQDGQNLFDPQGMWGGWRLQESLADVSPMLVVGIDNTAARFEDYTHVPDDIGDVGSLVVGGEGDAYADWVQGIVRPHIRSRYDTTTKTGVMGSSLGGLISLHIAQRFPGDYDFVGSMSGTLGWGRFGLENETMEDRWQADAPDIAVFLDSGGDAGANGCEDLDGDGSFADDPDATDGYCTSVDFAESLAAGGFTWDVDLWHWHEPGDPHNEAAWAQRVSRPLGLFSALED